jgi:hypothetical protein
MRITLEKLTLLVLMLSACSKDVDKERKGVAADCATACKIAVLLACTTETDLTQTQCEARCVAACDESHPQEEAADRSSIAIV